MNNPPLVLLTGAKGFVGRHLYHSLISAGCQVRSAARDPGGARERDPGQDWVELDFDRPSTMRSELDGCDAAFMLVDEIGEPGYEQTEIDAATNFRAAAEDAKLSRIVANVLSDEKDPGSLCEERRKRLVTIGEKWRVN